MEADFHHFTASNLILTPNHTVGANTLQRTMVMSVVIGVNDRSLMWTTTNMAANCVQYNTAIAVVFVYHYSRLNVKLLTRCAKCVDIVIDFAKLFTE